MYKWEVSSFQEERYISSRGRFLFVYLIMSSSTYKRFGDLVNLIYGTTVVSI